uniref:Lipocalin homologue n=1 Tax=Deinagkistrodon acutus TaxID=36307 RepID=C9QNM2_DEIAC|nr:lipocalin homologue [Deinagkistrodon acutus]
MKSWLFALGLALCCVVQANEKKPFQNFDCSKMARNWILRVIVTNCSHFENMIRGIKACPVSFVKKSQENMEMIMDMFTPQGCQIIKVNLTWVNGAIVATCGDGVEKTVEDVRINKNTMYTSARVRGKEQCKVATLAAKDIADIQPDLEDFTRFVNGVGLEGKKIYVLPTEDICPRSS